MPENKELINVQPERGPEPALVKSPELVDESAELILPREVETWMEKVEKGQTQTTTVTDDQGQALMQPSTPVSPKIVLPITRSAFIKGFKKKVVDAGRWLSAFIFRLIKMKKGKITFKEE